MSTIPDGRYRAKCVEAWLGEDKKGRDMLSLSFEIADGKQAGERATYYQLMHTPKGEEFAVGALRAVGWRGDVGDLDCCIGGEASITLETEEYQGKSSQRVKWVNPLRRELAPEKRAALAERLKFAVEQSGGILPPAPKRGDDEPPPISDDDIPF